jgi:hypothetical protein
MAIDTEGEQRRPWRLEDKLRIVVKAERPGAVQLAVARQHEINRNLLCRWRDSACLSPVSKLCAPAVVMGTVIGPSPSARP